MMICIDEVREMCREALERGEDDAVGNGRGFVVTSVIREILESVKNEGGLN